MKLSICSYSFYRLLEAGKHDMFKYIESCPEDADEYNGVRKTIALIKRVLDE